MSGDDNEIRSLVELGADELLVHLREKNEQLNRAIAESQQYAELWRWVANDNEKQKKELEETVNALNKANKQLAKAQIQLLQSEKLSAAGRLAAGIAHEMNNPLGFVRGNISTLENYIKDIEQLYGMFHKSLALTSDIQTEEVRLMMGSIDKFKKDADIDFVLTDMNALLKESVTGLDRALSIVASLKSFSHIDDSERGFADINMELDNSLKILSSQLHEIQVCKDYYELPLFNGYPSYLGHAFMSILENAIYAINQAGRKGMLFIKTAMQENETVIKITDNGRGIPEENLDRIFEPFFTTKPVGTGKGLGLALAYQAIDKHNGRLEATSKPGEWTSFTIYLPVQN